MKLIFIFLCNIIFSSTLSNWIDSNKHIINSQSYKILFDQKIESIIGGDTHSILDTNTSVIIFANSIRYNSSDRTIILNQDSLKIINKRNNQLFIDEVQNSYDSFLEVDLIKILARGELQSYEGNDFYYIKFNDFIDLKIYLENQEIITIEILNNNISTKLSNIHFLAIDSIDANNYFIIDNSSFSIFDLRAK